MIVYKNIMFVISDVPVIAIVDEALPIRIWEERIEWRNGLRKGI